MDVRHFPSRVVEKNSVGADPLTDLELACAKLIRHMLPRAVVLLCPSGVAFGADSNRRFENSLRLNF